MNNSKIAYYNSKEEVKVDQTELLQKRRGELSQIIEAINRVEDSDDWQKLKKLVLDGVVATIERNLKLEVSKIEINPAEIYRLQGQLSWARKYSDLKKLSEFFKTQIESTKHQINEQNSRDGAL